MVTKASKDEHSEGCGSRGTSELTFQSVRAKLMSTHCEQNASLEVWTVTKKWRDSGRTYSWAEDQSPTHGNQLRPNAAFGYISSSVAAKGGLLIKVSWHRRRTHDAKAIKSSKRHLLSSPHCKTMNAFDDSASPGRSS